jgi:TM2 domain-containing membrane protein YozV
MNTNDSTNPNRNETHKNTAQEFKDGVNDLVNSQENKKVLAGLMGIFLGGFGIHKFVLGYTQEGIILLAITLISFPLMCIVIGAFTIYVPFIIGLIEGIIYLTKSDQEFYEIYQVGRKPWF